MREDLCFCPYCEDSLLMDTPLNIVLPKGDCCSTSQSITEYICLLCKRKFIIEYRHPNELIEKSWSEYTKDKGDER